MSMGHALSLNPFKSFNDLQFGPANAIINIAVQSRIFSIYSTGISILCGIFAQAQGPVAIIAGGGQFSRKVQAQVCRRTARLLRSLLVLLGAGTAYAQLTVLEYPIPTPNSTPAHITSGPDGALWFTENATGKVGRVTIDGSFSEFSVAAVGSRPNGIVGGSDGALWFADSNASAVGRIKTSGAITKFPISGPAGNPVNFQPGSSGGIVAGPDGAIWTFVNSNSKPPTIVRITSEATTEYPLAAGGVGDITASSSDGAIWFTFRQPLGAPANAPNSVGRITTSGVITLFPLPIGETAGNILAGPDGTIWFSVGTFNTLQIGRITTTGVISELPAVLAPYKTVAQGAVWTLSPESLEVNLVETLRRVDISGDVTAYTLQAPSNHQFRDVTLGPDGAFWLTDLTNKIGRVGIPSPPLIISAFSFPLQHFGVPFSTTFIATGGTPPYKWSMSCCNPGPLPNLTLDPSTGTLSGTPLFASNFVNGGTFYFGVNVQDAVGATTSRSGSLTIDPLIPGSSFIGSLPHLAAHENWTTMFTLVNKSSMPAEAKLNFFGDPDGVLPLNLTAPGGLAYVPGAVFQQTFNSNGLVVVVTGGPQMPPVQVGSAQLSATGAVDGFNIFHHIVTQQETVVPLETRNASSYLLAFDNTGGSVLGIAVANVAAQDAQIFVVIRDDSGEQIATSSLAVPADGHTSFVLPTQYPITANLRGTIEFDTPSGGRISVLGMRFTPPNNALTTIPALANVGTNGGSIAHIASGNGWQTTFVLVNTGTVAAPFQLAFLADDGTPLALPIGFPQTASGSTTIAPSVSQTLNPGASLLIQSALPLSDPAPTIGSAQLTTSGNISGFVIYRYNPNGQEAVVPFESRGAGGYILAFDNTSGTATGVAVNSVSAQPADVPVIIRNEGGASIATDTIHLAPNGHSAFTLVTDKYPMTANIRGTIEFDTPPGGQIGALAFRIPTAHTFTTLPALAK